MSNRNQHENLHKFLDQQLEGVLNKDKSEPTFDRIEVRLKKIEEKLVQLKQSSKNNGKSSYREQKAGISTLDHVFTGSHGKGNHDRHTYGEFGQQTSGLDVRPPFSSVKSGQNKAEVNIKVSESKNTQEIIDRHPQSQSQAQSQCLKQSLIEKEKQSLTDLKASKNHPSWTPAKHLGSATKSMSAVHFGTPSQNETMKKERRKVNTSSRKINVKMQNTGNLLETKPKRQSKNTPRKLSKHYTNCNSSQHIEVRVLKRQLQSSERSNAELRRRMNDLKSYEAECSKLKQVFDRCQQLRRRNRLHKPRK